MKRQLIGKAVIAACLGALVSTAAIAGKPVKPPPAPSMGLEVFAAGQRIGWLLNFEPGGFRYNLLSPTGYFFSISTSTNALESPDGRGGGYWFSGTGCTGEVYHPADWHDWRLAQGAVVGTSDVMGGGIYYVPRNSQAEQRLVASYTSGEICINDSRLMDVTPLLPNDASITGVSTAQFPAPIVFGVP